MMCRNLCTFCIHEPIECLLDLLLAAPLHYQAIHLAWPKPFLEFERPVLVRSTTG